jgi:hypothetical protein
VPAVDEIQLISQLTALATGQCFKSVSYLLGRLCQGYSYLTTAYLQTSRCIMCLPSSSPPSLTSPAAVSSCVHALLGGVVDHRGTDAWDLADDTKLLQRLYALNVLRLEGHSPNVELWTVRSHIV